MTLTGRRLGVLSLFLELVAFTFTVIVARHVKAYPVWTSISTLQGVDRTLSALSLDLIVVSALVSFCGVFLDKKRMVSIATLIAVIPIIMVMAATEGAW
jgi:hypothetical protein